MITPKPGFIVDPQNSNGIIPDPNYIPAGMPGSNPTPESTATPPVVMTPPAQTTATVTATPTMSPEDQKLTNMGLTPEQITALNSPNGLDPSSFSNVVANVENKLKTNNDLVTTRGYLMKHLYDSPLTPDELSKLPPDVQTVIKSGNKDDIELQTRLINDQISGRAQTLNHAITALTTGYEKSQADTKNAVASILSYAQSTGKPVADVAKALAPIYGLKLTNQMLDNLGVLGIATKPAPGVVGGGVANTPGGIVSNVSAAITAQEGGNYDTVNPDSGALGKYQIMPFNLPEIGIPNTPEGIQQFLSNPALQDQLFQKITGDLATKYGGDPAKMAAAYYGGAGAVSKLGTPAGDVKQGNYPSINEYVSSVLGKMQTSALPPTGQLASIADPYTGRTPDATYSSAERYYFQGGNLQQYIGGLGSATGPGKSEKDKIANIAGAIEKATGIPAYKAQAIYKADASAAKQNIERLARVDAVAGTVASQFPRLAQMADQLRADGIDITESDIQAGAKSVLARTGNKNASNYTELLATIRGDYSAMLAALGGSRGGQFFAQNAEEAIPIGYTGDQYLGLKDTIEKSAENARTSINGVVDDLFNKSQGNNSSSAPDFSKMTDAELQDYIKQNGGQ